MHKPPLAVRIVLALIVISAILYFGITSLKEEDTGQLKASGTIESVTVNISPEMAGKVKEVLVAEGHAVKMGDPLLSLDGSLLIAQRAVAKAQLDSANFAFNAAQSAYETVQQQYDATLSNALALEKATRTSVWKESKPGEFNQPIWYFSKEERLTAAQADVDSTQKTLEEALKKLEDTQNSTGGTQFLEIEAQLAQARIAFQNAKAVYDSTSGASDSQKLRDAAQIALDEAEIALEDAQKNYDDLLAIDSATEVLEARASVVITQEIYDTAVDQLRALQTGMDSQLVLSASKGVDQAKTILEQARASVNTAEANLALIDAQMAKLTIYASMDGVVLTRNAEPGEFLQPGAVALTTADLNNLMITVYVPEDRYGQITLGQQADVTVDSFPGETFNAEVIHIADQAEFTPRNVQTVEGRSSTVYAIKLKVTDSEGKLKIGMPADVVFGK